VSACCLLAGALGADAPPVYDSEQSKDQPISGAEATAKIQLPEGFEARLFASEPMVRNPIALHYDARGRLWIAENFSYAERGLRVDPNLRDRLVIFEDRDQDGAADASTVFADSLNNLTGFAIGRGGVWAICPPQLLFIPDRDGDDRPDGPPQVVIDGFLVPLENHHNFANGLKFGPDGWLYGRSGGSAPSEIGKPGAAPADRIPLRGGVWRYHPDSKRFEALVHGTTNPWGMDWDAHGEAFFVNTVNGHLWHLTPGAHLDRLHTVDPNPFAYELIQQTADHYHFDTGQGWAASRDGAANRLGGGHAHQGALIYQGSRWPETFRGRLLTVNFHGRRINTERLDLTAMGYVGRHEKDLAIFGDAWFRGIDMAHTPDGNIVVIDWSDTGECHENTGVHRSSGRIYEIGVQGDSIPKPGPFRAENLLADLKSPNVFVARRAVQAVYDAPSAFQDQKPALRQELQSGTSTVHRLNILWALHAMKELTEPELLRLTQNADAHLRTWAVRLLLDSSELDTIVGRRSHWDERSSPAAVVDRLVEMARTDSSSLVRLTLASALQRMSSLADRARLAGALAARAEDATYRNLVLLVWYGVSPIAQIRPELMIEIARGSRWPILERYIARRLSAEMTEDAPTAALEALLSTAETLDDEAKVAVLQGLAEGLAGRDKVAQPKAWPKFAAGLRTDQVRSLSALFGDGLALDEIRKIVFDDKTDMKIRTQALRTLIQKRPDDLTSICAKLLPVRYFNAEALAGIALSADPKTADELIRHYRSFSLQDRPRVIDTLCVRPMWASRLLDAVAAGSFPRGDISVLQARQIRSLGDTDLNERLDRHWGRIGTPSGEKAKFLQALKAELAGASTDAQSLKIGRSVYMKTCGQCHTLYGEGGRLGPDITGAQRQNFDYLMENVLEPSAVVSPDFRLTQLAMKDGRVIAGLVRPRDNVTTAVVMPTQTVIVPKAEIAEEKRTDQSIMPEGQIEALSPSERIALIRYLMTESPPAE
jgi:putative membrane-bound dehydrogenase-like protein